MCLATVYLEKNGERHQVMREVAWIQCQGSRLQLVTLMRERQLLDGRIKSIDLMSSSVIVEAVASDSVQDDAQEEGPSHG